MEAERRSKRLRTLDLLLGVELSVTDGTCMVVADCLVGPRTLTE